MALGFTINGSPISNSYATWQEVGGGNGALWSWGNNFYGALGLSNTTYYSSPVQVGTLTNWSLVYSGTYHVLSTKTDGTLWAWGYNGHGALGQGNITNYSSPVQVGSLSTWRLAAGGRYHTVAIKNYI